MNNKAKILIVDDNLSNLQVLGNFLKEEEYLIAVAKDGFKAIELSLKIIPDLILLDIMMPKMDGYEVIRKLKSDERTSNIPVIFITAKVETNDIVKGFNLGCVDYILKPFKKEELLARVKTHVTLVKSQNKIKNQALELKQLVNVRDKMYSIIAHDLNSPLASIKMTLRAFQDGLFDSNMDKFNELINLLIKSTDETQVLLDNLLQWTKSQSGLIIPRMVENNLSLIIQEVLLLFEVPLANKKIELKTDLLIVEKLSFDGDMIKTVLRNLISNAIKFTPENGSIYIYVENFEKEIKINIKDTGVGISDEQAEKIFSDKEHFSSYGTNNEKGSGLGLILCQDFMKLNNGLIEFNSTKDSGSTFSMSFRR